MTTIENGKSSIDNIREVDWVQRQVKEELNALTNNVEGNFFEKKEDEKKVEYKMDVVKNYLNKLKDQVKDMDTRTAWQYLTGKDKKTAAWIMAVQIALESMGYEVERIDGILGTNTRRAVAEFQSKNSLNPDSYPGKDTIIKLCDSLDGKRGVASGDGTEKSDESSDKSGDGDGNKDKLNEGGEEPKKYIIENILDRKTKLMTIKSISELPEGYKRDNPENYDASNEDTYPMVYSLRVNGKEYRFFNNGRCATPEGIMENTKDVVEKLNKVENLKLNEGYPQYLYTGDVDSEGKPNGKGSVEFKSRKNLNKFEGIREHGRIVECTSYGNTIKIKYNTEGDAIFETSSGRTLKVENKNVDHVGRTASIINYIFKAIGDSGKDFDHFYMNHDHHLRVKYKDESYKKVLSDAYYIMRIEDSEALVAWLNEYSKEIIK